MNMSSFDVTKYKNTLFFTFCEIFGRKYWLVGSWRDEKGCAARCSTPFNHLVNQGLLGGEFPVVLDVDAPFGFARQLASAEVVVVGGSILLEHLDVLDAVFIVDHIEAEFSHILRVVTELEEMSVGRDVSVGIGLLHQVILLVTLENVGLHVGSIRVGDLLECT